jgi:CheY-like chemotaxis protein
LAWAESIINGDAREERLVVDDNLDGGDVLCRLLRAKGYPAEWTTDGRSALARIREHPPEQPLLVVLDEMMPLMSGTDVLQTIRSDPAIAHTPVIMYTAGIDGSKRQTAMALSASAVC